MMLSVPNAIPAVKYVMVTLTIVSIAIGMISVLELILRIQKGRVLVTLAIFRLICANAESAIIPVRSVIKRMRA